MIEISSNRRAVIVEDTIQVIIFLFARSFKMSLAVLNELVCPLLWILLSKKIIGTSPIEGSVNKNGRGFTKHTRRTSKKPLGFENPLITGYLLPRGYINRRQEQNLSRHRFIFAKQGEPVKLSDASQSNASGFDHVCHLSSGKLHMKHVIPPTMAGCLL